MICAVSIKNTLHSGIIMKCTWICVWLKTVKEMKPKSLYVLLYGIYGLVQIK